MRRYIYNIDKMNIEVIYRGCLCTIFVLIFVSGCPQYGTKQCDLCRGRCGKLIWSFSKEISNPF